MLQRLASLSSAPRALPALLVVACSAGGARPSTRPVPASTATVLLSGRGDLDGKPGDELLNLYSDGTLMAGDWSAKVEIPQASDYFRGSQSRISVELLDAAKGTRVVVLALPTEDEEDPPNRYQILVPRGVLLAPIYDQVLGTYGVTDLRFPGDGTVHYTQDSWSACRAGGESAPLPEEPVDLHDITLSLDASGALVESAKTPTGETFDCDDLAG